MDSQGVSPALMALNGTTRIEVQEKARMLEVITEDLIGFDAGFKNKYRVLDDRGMDILYAVEQTDCFRRMFKAQCADCVSWEVDIFHVSNGRLAPGFKIERPCTFTCCCFNRPFLTVTDERTGRQLGKVKDPFTCCDLIFHITDPYGSEVLTGNGGMCQWGMCCRCPCGPCSEVNFPISDYRSQKSVGHIKKKVPHVLSFLIASHIDNYQVEFGEVQNPDYKALLMSMAIFMDFRYFSKGKSPAASGGGLVGDMLTS